MGRSVLVVDDVSLNRRVLGKMVSRLGFDVLEAANGEECVSVYSAAQQQLSIVLLDLQVSRVGDAGPV